MPVFHIGPSKTASTSIQAIIPHLGRPYAIKADWIKPLCRAAEVPDGIQNDLPNDIIISDETIGDFPGPPPAVISKRFFQIFGRCTIVYVLRDLDERFASFFKYLHGKPWARQYASLEDMKATHRRVFEKRGAGLYATADLPSLRNAFSAHDFRVINFSLLRSDPRAFLEAFCQACGVPPPEIDLPHLNAS